MFSINNSRDISMMYPHMFEETESLQSLGQKHEAHSGITILVNQLTGHLSNIRG